MPNPKRPLGLLAVLVMLALLAGCSGGDTAARDSAAEPATVEPQGEEGRAGAGQTGKAGGATTARTPGEGQLLTYTATLKVRVDDPAAKATAAEKVVTEAGGYVERQNQTGEGSSAYATTRFRVPSAKYRDVLDRLGKLGERTSLTQQTENVTQRVADVDARIKSAKASLKRLRTLLNRATDVDDLVAIEAEISEREADLESLQATQRALAKQVEYATITLKLSTRPHTEDDERAGFLTGLRAGWHGFVTFLTGVATVTGTVLPFLILVAPAAAVGYLLWRRLRRRPAAETPAPETPAT